MGFNASENTFTVNYNGKTYFRVSEKKFKFFWIADLMTNRGNQKEQECGFSEEYPTVQNGIDYFGRGTLNNIKIFSLKRDGKEKE